MTETSMTETKPSIPVHLQKLADLTQTIRDSATGRIAWQRIEAEHPDAVAEATHNGQYTYKKAIDQLGYYLRRGQPKSKSGSARQGAAPKVPWTPDEIAAVQHFQRFQLPDGRMDWDKVRSTDAWARLLTRHTEPRIKGKFLYLREHQQLAANATAHQRHAASDLTTRLTQVAAKTRWTEDEENLPAPLATRLAEALNFCPHCGTNLSAYRRS